jgi:hypothetical protein
VQEAAFTLLAVDFAIEFRFKLNMQQQKHRHYKYLC